MTKLTVVIPHWGRDELLFWHLRELKNQTYKDFDTIVILDEDKEEYDNGYGASLEDKIRELGAQVNWSGNTGPGEARNIGAQMSDSEIILIAGSDCIPDINLIARHVYDHDFYDADAVQGYSHWHADVVAPFYSFLQDSGLQASWKNLQKSDGSFMRQISPSFCLTTNYSIKRQLLLNEPFDKRLNGPAWDDIEFGYRLSKYDNITCLFAPYAANFHYHRYGFDSFLERCKMEGYHRIQLGKLHPEMGFSLFPPEDLRKAAQIEEAEMILWAKELDNVSFDGDEAQMITLKEIKHARYFDACKMSSLKGVLKRIEDEHPAMKALKHVHSNEQVIQILSGLNALEGGYIGYLGHVREWMLAESPDNWAAWAFAGETQIECGNIQQAIDAFKTSLIINPRNDWAKNRLEELV